MTRYTVSEARYCERGQAENLIKLHKSQLASDRTSCRSALANQVRLVPAWCMDRLVGAEKLGRVDGRLLP